MAIFGIFGKKSEPPTDKSLKTGRTEEPGRSKADITARAQQAQRNAARANDTAKKIDAIESEMSSEFVPSTVLNINTQPGPTTPAPSGKMFKAAPAPGFELTLPTMGMSTEFLLGVEGKHATIEVASSDNAPATEEAAILFANGQTDIAEQMLWVAVAENTANVADRMAWWMLFDLYQVTDNQAQFENLSIEYANRFETSPPAWIAHAQSDTPVAPAARTGTTPAVAFSGKLDGSIIKLLERAQKLGESSAALRLEFTRVTEVDPVGCGLLLRILNKLQDSQHDLILVGAHELLTKIRSILEVGRRDETEAPWRLLMEILRLLNREKEFEEASIDYCITFEVSPPAFVAPINNVTTATDESSSFDLTADSFVMPSVIEGRNEQLFSAITAFVTKHDPAILDCSRLSRVDFNAAGQLLTCLAPLSAKTIELNHVNYLVTTLFNVMGLKDVARIIPRKL